MYFPTKNSGGTYRPTKETYPLMEALAVAVAVDKAQGFVKSQQGYYDKEREVMVNDNRNAALLTLRVLNGKVEAEDRDGVPVPVFKPTQEDYADAQEIFIHFDQKLLMDKMSDALVKVGRDGQVNRYNEDLARIFAADVVDVNRDLAMIVSLPNSRRISAKRDEMDEFYASNRNNGYIGEVKQRLKLSGVVKDVKFIPRHSIHLATMLTDEGKLAKFFMNDKLSDVAKGINGSRVTFVGTVKKHEVNTFTGCQETMFNRVKFE